MATTAVLNLGLNSTRFVKGMDQVMSRMTFFKAGMLAIPVIAGGVVAVGIAKMGMAFIKAGADAEETTNKFNAVFSNLQKTANDMSKSLAKSFGFSRREAEALLGGTGDLLTGFGFTQKAALNLSNSVQELASDLTSFQNFSGGVVGASEAITAALTGETEKMKALGVVIRQGTKEFTDNVATRMRLTKQTLLQAKAEEILSIITKQSKNALGDYAKTQHQLANQMKLTAKIWDDLKVGIGVFIVEFLGVNNAVLSVNTKFRTLTNNILGFLSNWKTNFKTLFNWLIKNFTKLFAHDIPQVFGAMVVALASNLVVLSNIFSQIFQVIRRETGDEWNELWTNDLPKGMLDGLDTMGKLFKAKMSSIFSPEQFLKSAAFNFLAETVEGLMLNGDSPPKDVASEILGIVTTGLGKLTMPSDLFKDVEFTSDKFEFDLSITDDFKDAANQAQKILESSSVGDATKSRSSQFAGAFEKGSVEAYKVEKNSLGNKTERDNLRANRRTAEAVENSTNQTLVTIGG